MLTLMAVCHILLLTLSATPDVGTESGRAAVFGYEEDALAGGPLLEAFLAELPREGDTVSLVVELNSRVNRRIRYVIREEAGIWTPERTLAEGRGSCRDSAVLLVAALVGCAMYFHFRAHPRAAVR